MSTPLEEARAELEAAQSALETALKAWDESVSELWRTSLALTQAQKMRVVLLCQGGRILARSDRPDTME